MFKKIHKWLEFYCHSKWAVPLLIIISFTESCVFFIPPEVLLIPMIFLRRDKAFYYWIITFVASVLGAICGYFLGAFLWDILSPYLLKLPGFAKNFDKVGNWYQGNAIEALLIAGFTPIPYKVFTVVAGVYNSLISLKMVVVTGIISRGIRYLAYVIILRYLSSEKAIDFIKKYFAGLTIIITLVIIGIIYIARHFSLI